jgi:hypothetical protein
LKPSSPALFKFANPNPFCGICSYGFVKLFSFCGVCWYSGVMMVCSATPV